MPAEFQPSLPSCGPLCSLDWAKSAEMGLVCGTHLPPFLGPKICETERDPAPCLWLSTRPQPALAGRGQPRALRSRRLRPSAYCVKGWRHKNSVERENEAPVPSAAGVIPKARHRGVALEGLKHEPCASVVITQEIAGPQPPWCDLPRAHAVSCGWAQRCDIRPSAPGAGETRNANAHIYCPYRPPDRQTSHQQTPCPYPSPPFATYTRPQDHRPHSTPPQNTTKCIEPESAPSPPL